MGLFLKCDAIREECDNTNHIDSNEIESETLEQNSSFLKSANASFEVSSTFKEASISFLPENHFGKPVFKGYGPESDDLTPVIDFDVAPYTPDIGDLKTAKLELDRVEEIEPDFCLPDSIEPEITELENEELDNVDFKPPINNDSPLFDVAPAEISQENVQFENPSENTNAGAKPNPQPAAQATEPDNGAEEAEEAEEVGELKLIPLEEPDFDSVETIEPDFCLPDNIEPENEEQDNNDFNPPINNDLPQFAKTAPAEISQEDAPFENPSENTNAGVALNPQSATQATEPDNEVEEVEEVEELESLPLEEPEFILPVELLDDQAAEFSPQVFEFFRQEIKDIDALSNEESLNKDKQPYDSETGVRHDSQITTSNAPVKEFSEFTGQRHRDSQSDNQSNEKRSDDNRRGRRLISGQNTMAVINLHKSFGPKEIVRGIGFSMTGGTVVGLLGPNGAGKTTTFYMIVGFYKPTMGDIKLNDVSIVHGPMYKRARMGIAYLPQEASIFRKLTVEENIWAILESRRDINKKQRKETLNKLIEEFSIGRIRKQLGYTLSGGERRRTEIARALAIEPKFLLLDEPFAGIDPIAVFEIKQIIRRLAEGGIGILITDHNVRDTLEITTDAFIISQGVIVARGSREMILENQTVREVYLGSDFKM